jgi:hypothetical protein
MEIEVRKVREQRNDAKQGSGMGDGSVDRGCTRR